MIEYRYNAEAVDVFHRKTSVALGNFDGVHLGHKEVLSALDKSCFPVAVTFDTPRSENIENGVILTESLKNRGFERLGIGGVCVLDFEYVRNMSPRQFVSEVLCGALNAGFVACGFNYRFGRQACGDADDLRRICGEAGISVTVVPPIEACGEQVSSTLIRQLLRAGDIPKASCLLGAPYTYDFPVVHGQKRGRVMGTPTINQVFPAGFCIPRFGVYASYVTIGGRRYPSMTNIGVRPTVGADSPLSETYIMDYSGDLYGKRIEVSLLEFLRDERRFSGLSELSSAISRDIAAAQKVFSKHFN